jgi:hypothetical protein
MKSVGVVNPVAGKCNAFAGAKTLGTYTISGIKLPVCGPRPDGDTPRREGYVAPYPAGTAYDGRKVPAGGAYGGYQCVELSVRWLWYRYKVPEVTANGAQVVKNYAQAYPTKFTTISNGTKNKAPQPGDVLSLSANSSFSDLGHTGVVVSSSVNTTTGTGKITVAEENYGGVRYRGNPGKDGIHTYDVTSWKVQYSPLPYIKWLRAK